MADTNEKILIQVDVDTDKMQKDLSLAISKVASLKESQKLLTQAIIEGKDADGQMAKELTRVTAELERNQRQVKSQTAIMQAATSAGLAQNASLDEQRQYLNTLQKAYANLSGEEKELADAEGGLRDQIKALSDSVKEQEMAMGDARRNVGNYRESLLGLSDSAHSMKEGLDGLGMSGSVASKGLDGFDKVSKLVAKNPLLFVLTLLVAAFQYMQEKIKKNEQAMAEFQQVTAGLGGAMEALEPIISVVAKLLVDVLGKAVEWVVEAIKKALAFADKVASWFGKDLGLAAAFTEAAEAAKNGTEVVEEETQKQTDAYSKAAEEQKRQEEELQAQREEMARRRRTELQNTLADLKKAMEEELKIKGLTEEEKAEIEAHYRAEAQKAIDAETEAARKQREEEEKLAREKEEAKLKAKQDAREKFGLDPGKTPEEQEMELLKQAYEQDLLNYEEYETAKQLIADKYSKKRTKNIDDEVTKATQLYENSVKATGNATAAALSALSDLLGEYADESKEAAKAQKAFALGAIIINQAMAVAEGAKGIAAAMAGAAEAAAATGPAAPFTLIAYQAQMVGQVLAVVASVASTIVQAKQLFSEAGNFANGGVIGGYTSSPSGFDNTYAHVGTGEMVLNASQQARLFEIANTGPSGTAYEAMTVAMQSAVAAMPAPVMDYKEFTSFESKVSNYNEIARI